MLKSVGAGEWKVYREGSTVHVIVCLENGQQVVSLSMTEKVLLLHLAAPANSELKVSLPVEVEPSTAQSRTHGNYVTVQVAVRPM